jgi:hypothetical protein
MTKFDEVKGKFLREAWAMGLRKGCAQQLSVCAEKAINNGDDYLEVLDSLFKNCPQLFY